MKRNTKIFCAALALVLVFGAVVGGTLAYLISTPDSITNTFTAGKVAITLTETDDGDLDVLANSYKMVPGDTITKDPTVTVLPGSEASYVFIKVEKGANNAEYIDWAIDDSVWTELNGVDGVYYLVQDAVTGTEGIAYPVIKGNTVTVLSTVSASAMQEVADGNAKVSLAFTAFAIQQDNTGDTAEAAWTALQNQIEADANA